MLKNKCSVWKRIKFPAFWYNCYYFTWSDTYFIQLETLLINHPSYLFIKTCPRRVRNYALFLVWNYMFKYSTDRCQYTVLTTNTNEMHYFSNLFWHRTLHVSDRFTVHHQESSTVYTAIGICHTGYAGCLLARSGWNSMELASVTRIYHYARSSECQTNTQFYEEKLNLSLCNLWRHRGEWNYTSIHS